MDNVKIRKATINDVSGCMALAEEFHDESLKHYNLSLDETKFRAISNEAVGHSFVLEDNGVIVGVIALRLISGVYSFDTIAEELLWYVKKEYRGKFGIKLLTEAEKYCKSIGVKILIISHMGNLNNRLFRIYRRRGFKLMQSMYSKEL